MIAPTLHVWKSGNYQATVCGPRCWLGTGLTTRDPRSTEDLLLHGLGVSAPLGKKQGKGGCTPQAIFVPHPISPFPPSFQCPEQELSLLSIASDTRLIQEKAGGGCWGGKRGNKISERKRPQEESPEDPHVVFTPKEGTASGCCFVQQPAL